MRPGWVLLAGCGRIGFEPGTATDAAPDAFDESRCTWGPDGRTLYFEVERTGGFFIARARRPSIDAPFGPVEAVAELDGAGSHGDAQPSFDGTELYVSSDRGDPGNFDLYVSGRVCE